VLPLIRSWFRFFTDWGKRISDSLAGEIL